jgi:hypothetical protein
MAEFTVNPDRLIPTRNFNVRVKWDGWYIAGISRGKPGAPRSSNTAKAAPLPSSAIAGKDRIQRAHAGARHHPRHGLRGLGQRCGGLARRPAGSRARRLSGRMSSWTCSTRRESASLLKDSSLLGIGISGNSQLRRERECRRQSNISSWRTKAGSETRRRRSRRSRNRSARRPQRRGGRYHHGRSGPR